MFLSFMFLMNLAVGVVVEKFFEIKKESIAEKEKKEGAKSKTELQVKLINGRKALFKRSYIFDLTNLHLLPVPRRRVYELISSKPFERFIMTAIIVNTGVMACTAFPEPTPWWSASQKSANYVFAGIYTVEAILKLVALQKNYWLDHWNKFDFTCVIATLIGIILKQPPFNIELGSITQVIRVLRIARLFRLLRFLKELNRLFMCLLISIPKLCYVGTVLFLFLVLFSVLGNQLFATAKFNDNVLDVHGNFWSCYRGFVTLLRASTGEAWNEIMHDLAKTERDFFHAGQWCSPQSLFKSTNDDVWEVLNEKCLIPTEENHYRYLPNACPGSYSGFSYLFWVFYFMILSTVILNLIVAVILEGYEEGKVNEETDNIDICIDVWKALDVNHRMELPLKDALTFMNLALRRIGNFDMPDLRGSTLSEISRNLPMKYARAFDMEVMPNNNVTHYSAFQQVLRLAILKGVITEERLAELERVNEVSTQKDLRFLEKCRRRKGMTNEGAHDMRSTLAVMRIQQRFRRRKAEMRLNTSRMATSSNVEALEDNTKDALPNRAEPQEAWSKTNGKDEGANAGAAASAETLGTDNAVGQPAQSSEDVSAMQAARAG
jgi:hypothetical protein